MRLCYYKLYYNNSILVHILCNIVIHYKFMIYTYIIFFLFIVIQLQLSAFSPHPSTPSQPILLPSPTSILPFDLVLVAFIVVPVIPSPHYPLPTPFWLLLDCSSLQCLWLYFVCFFLLLIMFQSKVRSYGICPSPPGLFHSMDGTGEHYAK